MKQRRCEIVFCLLLISLCGCKQGENGISNNNKDTGSCHASMPSRLIVSGDSSPIEIKSPDSASHFGMRFIPAGEFMMGAGDDEGREDEYPQHRVRLDSFWMDDHEVTNAEFARFIKATGYITIAERKPDWEELKKQLPPGTPKPADDVLVPASLVFTPPSHPVPLNNASQWWTWTKGANWQHPTGPNSSIKGKENLPVIHIAWEDATAYAKWIGKRLPTEAEWEYAARGRTENKKYPWGNEDPESNMPKANTWQGNFPNDNNKWDGYSELAPVKSFKPNNYGLYDMAGNVWEWVADWYKPDYYTSVATVVSTDPQGPQDSYDPDEPTIPKRVTRGGSFMCNASYCKGYRVSSRMKASPDTGLENTGFRCVSSK